MTKNDISRRGGSFTQKEVTSTEDAPAEENSICQKNLISDPFRTFAFWSPCSFERFESLASGREETRLFLEMVHCFPALFARRIEAIGLFQQSGCPRAYATAPDGFKRLLLSLRYQIRVDTKAFKATILDNEAHIPSRGAQPEATNVISCLNALKIATVCRSPH